MKAHRQDTQRPLDIDAVRAFVYAAQLGSFTRAAETVGSSQAAISLRIKRLEAHWASGCWNVRRAMFAYPNRARAFCLRRVICS